MSTTTAYGARPDLTDVLVVTVSQSGGSPDLVASTRAAREAGAITLAVTNDPDSPPAGVSEYHIDILAGPEKALPATKTYTASLLALCLRGARRPPARPLRPDRERGAARLLDRGDRLLGRLLLVPVVHRDPGSVPSQPLCDAASDSPARPRDECRPAAEHAPMPAPLHIF